MRRLIVSALLLLVMLAAVPVFNTIRPPLPPVSHVAVAHAPTPATPHVPTEFEREMAMTPQALMVRWEPLVKEASRRFDVPPEWIRAVIRMESGGRQWIGEGVPTLSDMGAMGIMQVLPQTYAEMRVQYGLGNDPYDPHDNVIAGTAYLKWLYGKYGNPAMFAAYNDGPGNLEAFLTNARELPAQTHNYVAGIGRLIGQPGQSLVRLTKVTLTRPDGSLIEVDSREVSAVRAASPGEYAPGVATVVSMGNKKQGVKEDAAAVAAALRAKGAKL